MVISNHSNIVHLPLRGQHRLGEISCRQRFAPLFPVELQHANHAASTNSLYSSGFVLGAFVSWMGVRHSIAIYLGAAYAMFYWARA